MIRNTQDFVKIKVEGWVSAQALAEEYEMTVDEVVDFHEAHCAVYELMMKTQDSYVHNLYLPKDKYDHRQAKLIKITRLRRSGQTERSVYGIIEEYPAKDLRLHYEVILKNGGRCFEKGKTFINEEEVQLTTEQFFENAERALYPMHLLLNDNGSVDSIENAEEVYQRWRNDVRPNLADYYQSETGKALIEKMDEGFLSIKTNPKILQHSLFFQLFFLPVYKEYPKNERTDGISIYFEGISRMVPYDLKFELEKEYTRSGKIRLHITGSEKENILHKDNRRGAVEIDYKFDRQNHDLFSINAKFTAYEKGKEYKVLFQAFEIQELPSE